jgi:hypothetical protein
MRSYMILAVLVLAASTISPAMSAPGQLTSCCKAPQFEYECIPILLAMSLIFMLVPEGKNLNRAGLKSRRENRKTDRTSVFRYYSCIQG